MFNLKKKYQPPQKNNYDTVLSSLLNDDYIQTVTLDLKRYVKNIYIKQKSLPIYPEGQERDMALARIESNKQCLQIAIREYEEWREKTIKYIEDNVTKFEYYHDYETGERMYPPTAYQIIDNTVSRMD